MIRIQDVDACDDSLRDIELASVWYVYGRFTNINFRGTFLLRNVGEPVTPCEICSDQARGPGRCRAWNLRNIGLNCTLYMSFLHKILFASPAGLGHLEVSVDTISAEVPRDAVSGAPWITYNLASPRQCKNDTRRPPATGDSSLHTISTI